MIRYKIGDRVRIKTWEEMEKEYGLINAEECINIEEGFYRHMEKLLNKLNTNRVLTIKIVNGNYYKMEEMGYCWTDEMIECLALDYKEEKILEPPYSRFEILDL